MAAYAADKARVADGRHRCRRHRRRRRGRAAGALGGAGEDRCHRWRPGDGQLGVRDGVLTDAAFGAGASAARRRRPPGRRAQRHQRAGRRRADAGHRHDRWSGRSAGCATSAPAATATRPVAEVGGVRCVDDSKATNPHAAFASLSAYPHVVWVAGGQFKGAAVDESGRRRRAPAARRGADRRRSRTDSGRTRATRAEVPRMLLSGTDDGVMTTVVAAAADMAVPGDVVLLAPAAASLDMFASYAARGDAFAAASRSRRRLPIRYVRDREPRVGRRNRVSSPATTNHGPRGPSRDRSPPNRGSPARPARRPGRRPISLDTVRVDRPARRLVSDRAWIALAAPHPGLAGPADDIVPPADGGVLPAARLRAADGAVVVVGGRLRRGRLVVQHLQDGSCCSPVSVWSRSTP